MLNAFKANKEHFWQSAVILFFLLIAFCVPFFVFAQTPLPANQIPRSIGGNAGQALEDELDRVAQPVYGSDVGGNTLDSVIANVINGFLAILGVVFLAYMLHGGYLWMSAAGNDDQVRKAKDEIRDAIIGIIVIVAAYAIVSFVLNALGGIGGGGGAGSFSG